MQTIFYKVGNDEYRKTLTTTFYLTSKKNSIVFGSVAANSWKEHELHVIKEIIEGIKKNASYKNLMTKSSKYAFPKEIVENPGSKAKKVKIYFTGLELNEADCPASITSDKGDDFSSGDEENCSGNENNEASNSDKEEIRILKQKLKEKEKEIQKLKKRAAELEDKREELEIKVSNISLDNEMFKKAYKSEKKERMKVEDLLAESSTSQSSSSSDSSDEGSSSEEESKRKRKTNQNRLPKKSKKKTTTKKPENHNSSNVENVTNNTNQPKLISFPTENGANMPRRPVCKFFINGECNRVPCRFFHPRQKIPRLEKPQVQQPVTQEILQELKNMKSEFQQDIRYLMDTRTPYGLQGLPIRQTFYPRQMVGNGLPPMQMQPTQNPIQANHPQNLGQNTQG